MDLWYVIKDSVKLPRCLGTFRFRKLLCCLNLLLKLCTKLIEHRVRSNTGSSSLFYSYIWINFVLDFGRPKLYSGYNLWLWQKDFILNYFTNWTFSIGVFSSISLHSDCKCMCVSVSNSLIPTFEDFVGHLVLFRIAVLLLLSQGGRLDDFIKSTVKWGKTYMF